MQIQRRFWYEVNTTNTFTANALVSVDVVNFIPETSLYLHSDLIMTKNNNTYNVLQEFYNQNAVPFSNLVYQCRSLDGYSKAVNQKKTNSFSLILLDEHGLQVDLNGQPFFLTLLFYKANDTYDM